MEDCIHYLNELKIDPRIGKGNAVVNKSIAIELVIQTFNLIEMRKVEVMQPLLSFKYRLCAS